MTRDCELTEINEGDNDVVLLELPTKLPLTTDENVLYTASLHFLQQRLLEKTSNTTNVKARDLSQSCCNFSVTTEEAQTSTNSLLNKSRDVGCGRPYVPLLTMRQVLPFPKGKESFFNRLKHAFRKNRPACSDRDRSVFDLEHSRCNSRYKFPRCERMDVKNKNCNLMQITEERSTDSLGVDHIIDTSTQKNTKLRKKKQRTHRRVIY